MPAVVRRTRREGKVTPADDEPYGEEDDERRDGGLRSTRERVREIGVGEEDQVWVIDNGQPVSGGLFAPGTGTLAIPVDGSVGNGSVAAVTVEDDGGASTPTGKPVIASAPVSVS